jgi:hypothetical protein
MMHVVLLGDSILDNAPYVQGGQPVIEQLRAWLGRDCRATLLAIDGATVDAVDRQLPRMPADATHLFVSVGGNDALLNMQIIDDRSTNARRAFDEVAVVQQRFQRDYRYMMSSLLKFQLPLTVCTIYDAVPGLERSAVTALSIFNDVIIREASSAGIPVLDLRAICDEPRDYSSMSAIEPSEIGGSKIVRGIKKVALDHNFARGETVVYGSRSI